MTAKIRTNVELPFHMPMFSTYHNLATPGVVARNNPESDNWYFNHAIELQCQRIFFAEGSPLVLLSNYAGNVWQMKFIEKASFQTRFIKSCAKKVIQEMLEQNYYVSFVGVDDYYVKGKSWYKERHFSHDGLITGVNNDMGTYTIAAYDQRWIYRPFQTTQRCFFNGMRAVLSSGGNGHLLALKCTENPVSLSIPHICQELTKYLAPQPDPDGKSAFGTDVYPRLYAYFERLQSGETPHEKIDRRLIRLIWEHKQCMVSRIAAVEAHCGLSSELSVSYAPLAELTNTLRLMYAKYVLCPNGHLLDSIKIKLQELTEREGLLLQKLIAQIE